MEKILCDSCKKKILSKNDHICRNCKKDLPNQPAGWFWFQDGWAYDCFGFEKYCKKCLKNGHGDVGVL